MELCAECSGFDDVLHTMTDYTLITLAAILFVLLMLAMKEE